MRLSCNRKAAVKILKQLVFTSKSETDSFRAKIEETFSSPILPNRVECSEYLYGGIVCDILIPQLYSSRRVLLYIHGGSFIGGSRSSWRPFCAALANITSSRTVVPEIRLAPAHPFPAAIEDIQTVFRSMYTEEQIACSLDRGRDQEASDPEIIIAADGSGASQALAFLLNLRGKYRKSIKQVILMSPWLNFASDSSVIIDKKNCDEVMSGDSLRRSSEIYTYASNLTNPFISPVFATAESLVDFPPVYIQIGEKEILLKDARNFTKKLEDAGVACTLDIWPDMIFMFQMADEYLPESHLALEKIGNLVTARRLEPEDRGASYKPETEYGINADA
jgi:epsilon-lactone hydrolase